MTGSRIDPKMGARICPAWRTAAVLVLVVLAGCGGGNKKKEVANPLDTDPKYKARMAESLFTAGRVGEALTLMEEAIEIEPTTVVYRLQLGILLFRAGRYTGAEAAFLEALRIDPTVTDARNFLGTVYQELGRFDDAEREYRTALEDLAYPTPENIYLNLGILYFDREQIEEAIEALRTAVGIDPKFHKAHYQLASVLESTGGLKEACREYEVAEPGFRQSGEYYYRRCFCYYRLDQLHEAREMCHRVISIAPGSASAAKADDLLEMMD